MFIFLDIRKVVIVGVILIISMKRYYNVAILVDFINILEC